MNPLAWARRRPILTLLLMIFGLATGVALAWKEVGADIVPALDTARIASWFDSVSRIGMSAEPKEQAHDEHHKIVATSPMALDVTIAQPYVCQIHARRHIEVRALVGGYLQEIRIQEGQRVKEGEVMFKILPVVYEAKLDADSAEAQLAGLQLKYTKQLAERKVVSENEVKLREAELAKAQAEVDLAKAELNFTNIVAPFDGIVDRLHTFLGSLIEEGEVLTSLTDNSVMWVYFNVPEADYIEYMSGQQQGDLDNDDGPGDLDDDDGDDNDNDGDDDDDGRDDDGDNHEDIAGLHDKQIELVLANGHTFPHIGKIAAIEAEFNNETGTIPFRADFPNPDGLLRHGQTGNVLLRETLHNAVVIPQRATFGILDKQYVWVVDGDDVVHQREVVVQHEKEDIYVIKTGLSVDDKIVLDGVRQIHDGEKVEYEYRKPDEVLANLKYHAE